MPAMKFFPLAAAMVAGALLLGGCPGCAEPDPLPPPDAGEVEDAGVDAGEDGGVDAGPFPCETDNDCQTQYDPDTVCDKVEGAKSFGTCVPRCRHDNDCESYQVGLRCQLGTGHCILGRGCQFDHNCTIGFDPTDYCSTSGGGGVTLPGCRCVTPEEHPSGLGGVCRRRISVCGECQFDEQCGSGPTFEPNGRCMTLQGDPDGQLPDGGTRKYCFYAQEGPECGCGMVLQNNMCVPQSRTCKEIGCSKDAECPFGSVCNADACLCEPRCAWNFEHKKLDSPGCHPTLSCWVDKENLGAQSTYFGAGRCRPPCTSDEECQDPLTGGDPRLVCKGELMAGGGLTNKRCRPEGECMDDFECPDPVPGDIYLGYCDRASFSCKKDCRVGHDPRTSEPYDDCTSGYKCVTEGSANVCKQMSCLELGGRIACYPGQFCCGDDKDLDGMADACPSALEAKQCYFAPSPPFCVGCQSHAECAGLVPASGSPLPSLCIYAGDPPGGPPGSGVGICGVATWNNYSVGAMSGTPADRGCPAGYFSMPSKVQPCTSNAQCDAPGAPGTGVCGPDPYDVDQDGNPILSCLCKADGTGTNASMCPKDEASGVQSVCRHAPAGTDQYCLWSVVCRPSGSLAYLPPEEGGCGFGAP